MASDDSKIDAFLELIFLHSRNSEANESGFDKDVISAIAAFKKKMVILFLGLHYMNCDAFTRYFSFVIPVRENVFALIGAHCFEFYQMHPDPFVALLYSAYFIYSTLFTCRYKNLTEYEQFCPLCMKSIFHHRIKDDFYLQGGWQKLLTFSQQDNITELIDLIRYIYTEKYYLYKTVNVSDECRAFGICSIDVLKIGLRNLGDIESKLQSGFITLNPKNSTRMEESFKKLKNALETKLSLFDTSKENSK